MGRKKVIDKGPRNIDLDILLYGNEVVNHERLTIPHALMLEREFVLRPLSECVMSTYLKLKKSANHNRLIPNRALDQKSPWKLTQDYLNALPVSSPPLSTITPLRSSLEPLRALKANRKTEIMAILNLTPDSFSNEGQLPSLGNIQTSALNHATAKILDIGGQSTAPNAEPVSAEVELNRIFALLTQLNDPAQLQALNLERDDFAISVDTFYASVAKAAILAGADIINDISAGQLDPEMLSTIAQSGKTICLMHMRGTPSTMNKLNHYPEGLIPTIARELLERVAAAEAAGIRRWRIILDPGIGFAKNLKQNLEILRNLDELREWPGLRGFPWLVGTSRKRFIGTVTGVERASERVMGTAATVAASVWGGADVVRVHDVGEMVQVIKMADAIWRSADSLEKTHS